MLLDIRNWAKSVLPTLRTVQRVSNRHWELSKEWLTDLGTSSNTLAALQREREAQLRLWKSRHTKMPPIPMALWIFIPALAICFQIANSCIKWRCNFKGLSQQRGRADFSKNLRASLSNGDQSNEPNFRPDPSRWTLPLKEQFYHISAFHFGPWHYNNWECI
jgi:hypothetical protein